MKKIVTLLMVLALVLSLSVSAFADDTVTSPTEAPSGSIEEETEGFIVIRDVVAGATYKAYQIFKLESYDNTKEAYSYIVNDEWLAFATTGAGKDYVTVEGNYVTWTAATDDATAAAFAAAALEYAKENDIEPTVKHTVNATTGFTFGPLELGYYLVDSSLGALCNLTTTDNHAFIYEKNPEHTIDKTVQKDIGEEGDAWGKANDTSFNEYSMFMLDINIAGEVDNLTIHDSMTNMEFDILRSITLFDASTNLTAPINAAYYELIETCEDDCAFEIVFTAEFCALLAEGDKIEVVYTGNLTEDALITGEGENDSWLEFGDEFFTVVTSTETHTYKFDLVKTDSDNVVLDGAQFKLYSDADCTHELKVVKDQTTDAEGNTEEFYRVVSTDEADVDGEVIVAGSVTIKGLDSGTYYLMEIEAPKGYNKIDDPIVVTIAGADLEATTKIENDVETYVSGGVHVVNNTGFKWPETGSIGTTIFYVVGGLLLFSTVVLLITKKRMANAE